VSETSVASERVGRLVDNFLLMFVGLKLAGFIEWSWWWVLAPLWGAFLLGIAANIPEAWRKEKQRRAWIKKKEERAANNGSE